MAAEQPCAGTVKSAMAHNTLPPDVGGGAEEGPTRRPVAHRRFGLEGRTVAVCACIALVAALAAGLIVARITGDSSHTGAKDPKLGLSSDRIDTAALVRSRLTTIGGGPTTLQASLKDKPLVVNLWQQSCAPCIAEMPLLEQLNQGDRRVQVVGIDVQDRLDHATEMARKTGITYPWFRDERGDFFYVAKGTGLPKTLLLSRSGAVLATKNGAFKDRADLDGWLNRNLA